ncbi:HNH endonuclease [Thalassospira sp.]|uniref:HNH endonuclease n=1 Tax=Thalassospira sp. TaxID=1912094 RepID=UPI00273753ED|nr:HNH endonuclease [Thalassospira sp.]MDP2696549.1 HNH endonuclease [Thalassospira sp.]
MKIERPQEILEIPTGVRVSKRNLYDLIQYSKVENSEYWGGEDFAIGNTPQQGINWIGKFPNIYGAIIKVRPGSYDHDGWLDQYQNTYRYSLKARNSVVSFEETANRVLISQPQFSYPILLFVEEKAEWIFEGRFIVSEIKDVFVVLERHNEIVYEVEENNDIAFMEGGRRHATHLLVERSKSLTNLLKLVSDSTCDICDSDFFNRYGVAYIEAHHKIPLSTFEKSYQVRLDDLAPLCPSCHRATHIYMRQNGLEYEEIKTLLRSRMCL